MRLPYGFPIALFAGLALAGCGAPFLERARTKPVPPTRAVVSVSQTNIAIIAKGVLSGLEATAASYVLSGSATRTSQTRIATAEVVAENFVNSLGTTPPADFPDTLKASSNAIKAFTATLPPARISPSVMSGLSAYIGFADVMSPVLRNPDTPIRVVP